MQPCLVRKLRIEHPHAAARIVSGSEWKRSKAVGIANPLLPFQAAAPAPSTLTSQCLLSCTRRQDVPHAKQARPAPRRVQQRPPARAEPCRLSGVTQMRAALVQACTTGCWWTSYGSEQVRTRMSRDLLERHIDTPHPRGARFTTALKL